MSKIKVMAGDIPQGEWTFSAAPLNSGVISLSSLSHPNVALRVISVQQISETHLKKFIPTAAWGVLGYGLLGPLGSIAGMLSGGNRSTVYFACSLLDGRSFMGATDAKTFQQLLAIAFDGSRTGMDLVQMDTDSPSLPMSNATELTGATQQIPGRGKPFEINEAILTSALSPKPDNRGLPFLFGLTLIGLLIGLIYLVHNSGSPSATSSTPELATGTAAQKHNSEVNSITIRGQKLKVGDTADQFFGVLRQDDLISETVGVDPKNSSSLALTKHYKVNGETFVVSFARVVDPGPYIATKIVITVKPDKEYVCQPSDSPPVASGSAGAEWITVHGTENFPNIFFDPATIRKEGNRVKLWHLVNFSGGKYLDNKRYMSAKVQSEYDCKEAKYRILALTSCSESMGKGEVVYTASTPDAWRWEPVSPTSADEYLWKIACGKPKSKEAESPPAAATHANESGYPTAWVFPEAAPVNPPAVPR